ncbi:MAG: GNAT family N-acetyltransferase [Akkermansiaceae bacterium]|nr:GNAT family N-acetyltransferase [Akkermansiaceae bacterium]
MTSADHRDAMERCIAKNTVFCACVGGVFAGGTAFSPKHGGIGFPAGRPEYRRRGIGSLLIWEALSCMPQDRGMFVHIYPGVSAARSLYLSLGFREDEFIWQEGQGYQTLLLSPERLKGIVRQRRNFSAAGGCL